MESFMAALTGKEVPLSKRKEFVEKATSLKNDGNEKYRKFLEEYKKAIDQRDAAVLEKMIKESKRLYHLARLQAQAAYPFNPKNFKGASKNDGASTSAVDENAELEKECYDLIAAIYNNLAAVILAYPEGHKNDDYKRATEYCSNALCIQPNNAKAMYRKAQALEKMGQLGRAVTYYRDADLAENHKNAAIQRDLARLQTQIAEAKKQSNEELKGNLRRGVDNMSLGLATDAAAYGKEKEKKKGNKKRYADSPSRGSSSSPSESSESDSSSSGRSSTEE